MSQRESASSKTIVLNDQGGSAMSISEDVTNTLRSEEHGHQPIVLENHPQDSRMKIKEDGVFQTMGARMGAETDPQTLMVLEKGHDMNEAIVRRLTPLECERLQGYPDGWTDIGDWTDSKGKKHKGDADSPRYKALGNSIALPFWEWLAGRMVKHLDKENPTMASLFDGIGGFPLAFSRHGVKPVWASEIEEFPIAVTTIRFSEKGVQTNEEKITE